MPRKLKKELKTLKNTKVLKKADLKNKAFLRVLRSKVTQIDWTKEIFG